MLNLPGHPLLILGLGRSGTSYLASFLQANGVDLGSDLGGPGFVNPRGFFEDRRIVDFHRRLLTKRDPRAADIPLLAVATSHGPDPSEAEEAVRILEALARPGLWGWKDPRTLLFIDFWLGLLPDARLVVPIRHPVENYTSYLKRIRTGSVLNPIAFFRAYARQSRRLLDVAKRHAPRVLVLEAQSAYRQPERLWRELSAFLEVEDAAPARGPSFHEDEFTRLPISERGSRAFAGLFPEAAQAFRELDEMARIRFLAAPGSLLDPALVAVAYAFSKKGGDRGVSGAGRE